jgi:hypothetical protein
VSVIESYRYRGSAEFAWAIKMDDHAGQDWTMLRRDMRGGCEYLIVNAYPGDDASFDQWFAEGFRIRDAHRGADR